MSTSSVFPKTRLLRSSTTCMRCSIWKQPDSEALFQKPFNNVLARHFRAEDTPLDGQLKVRKVVKGGKSTLGMKEIRSPLVVRPKGPYSQAISTPIGVYCSGQLPLNTHSILITGPITLQTRQCLSSLSHILKEAHSSLNWIIKVQIFHTKKQDLHEINEEYAKWIKHRPARTCAVVESLHMGAEIMIDCVAMPGFDSGSLARERWISKQAKEKNMGIGEFKTASSILEAVNGASGEGRS